MTLEPSVEVEGRESIQRLSIRRVRQDLPILSDAGAGLVALTKSHGLRHNLCFRHILESLGTKTSAAILARRVLFSSTEREYQELRVITLPEFLYACGVKGTMTDKAQRQFATLFALSQNDEGDWIVDAKDPFPECALWGLRGLDGIASRSNHSEGFHRVLNRPVLDIRKLTRRIAKVTQTLQRKAHGYEAHGWHSAKATLQKPAAKAKSGKGAIPQPDECSCGRGGIYKARFYVDNCPCLHTVGRRPEPVLPKLNPIPDLKGDRHTVRTARARGPWNVCQRRDRRQFTPFPETENPEIPSADQNRFGRWLLSELLYLSLRKVVNRDLIEITLAMDFDGFARDEGANTGGADPQHSPEIRFAFQLRWFRECRALEME
jgi:hypothetical protein